MCYVDSAREERVLRVSRPWTRSFRTQLVLYFIREKGLQEKQMFLQGWQLLLVMSVSFCGKYPHPKGFMITSQLLQVRTIIAFRHALIVFANHDSFTANSSLALMGCGRRATIFKKKQGSPKGFFSPYLEHKTFQQGFCVAIHLHLLVSCCAVRFCLLAMVIIPPFKSHPIVLCLKGCTFRITSEDFWFTDCLLKPTKFDEDDLSKTQWIDMSFFFFL